MPLCQTSRRRQIRFIAIAVLLLIPCLIVIKSWNSTTITPDKADALIRDLANRHASDSEVVACLGDTNKLKGQPFTASGFSNVDYVRKWKFHHESLELYSDLETTGFFDLQGKCITFIIAMERLEGKRLWLFRWQRLLKHLGM